MSDDDRIKAQAPAAPAPAYTPAGGPRLAEFLDALPVKTRWIHNHRVVWQTGQQNAAESQRTTEETHCSAFVAAVALMLDIYILRAPHHGQEWTRQRAGRLVRGRERAFGRPHGQGRKKWIALGSSGHAGALKAAVDAANLGKLVVGLLQGCAGIGRKAGSRPRRHRSSAERRGRWRRRAARDVGRRLQPARHTDENGVPRPSRSLAGPHNALCAWDRSRERLDLSGCGWSCVRWEGSNGVTRFYRRRGISKTNSPAFSKGN